MRPAARPGLVAVVVLAELVLRPEQPGTCVTAARVAAGGARKLHSHASPVASNRLPLPFHQPRGGHLKNRRRHHAAVAAHIIKSSHFAQHFKLGYKILLLCVAKGKPLPRISWYRDGQELPPKRNTHLYGKRVGRHAIKSKVEIDPATIGDQGIYLCIASNPIAFDHKSFKTEYYY